MKQASPLFNNYDKIPDKEIEYKIEIAGNEFYNPDIFAIKTSSGLSDGNIFSIGNVVAGKLEISIKVKNQIIPKMAEVMPSFRYNGTNGPTEWITIGSYYIDTREKKNDKLILICYDNVLKAEKPFIQNDNVDDYPMLMTDAYETICQRIGVRTDTDSLNANFRIDYPNEMTMREVLSSIASANAGNFVILDGVLKLIKPKITNTSNDVASFVSITEVNDVWKITRVTMFYDDEGYFTAGDDTGEELIVSNYSATQEIVNYVHSQINGYVHRACQIERAYISPLYEVGDSIRINGIDFIIFNADVTYNAGVVYDIISPGESAIEHEYPYEGQISRALKSKVALGQAYEGVTITRAKGIEVKRTDGSAEALFNSKTFSMRAKINEQMVDCIYFDASKQKYRVTGDVIIDGSLSSDATFTDSLYAEQGDISQLTVDWLDTSSKIKRYLLQDTSDMNYLEAHEISMEFITASVVFDNENNPLTEQLKNRYNQYLFWQQDVSKAKIVNGYPFIDDIQVYTQTDTTDYPVIVYQYNEAAKMRFLFEEDEGRIIPKMQFGAGVGNLDHPEWGKGFIFKKADGLYLQYYNQSTGEKYEISLTDKGISFTENTLKGLKFYRNGFWVQYGKQSNKYKWEKDTQGRIIKLIDENNEEIPINYVDGDM